MVNPVRKGVTANRRKEHPAYRQPKASGLIKEQTNA
jgi:hypothetical protein